MGARRRPVSDYARRPLTPTLKGSRVLVAGGGLLIGRHSLDALLRARHASDELRAMAQGLRGFYLADSDQISALPGVELSLSRKIRDT